MPVEDEERIITTACENIVGILETGDPKRILTPESDVLIIGDHGDLSPLYTEIMGITISRLQRGKGSVHVKMLPKERPMTDNNRPDPEITDLARSSDVIIITTSNPGEEIIHQETDIRNESYLDIGRERMRAGTIRNYCLAARMDIDVLRSFSDEQMIRETNELSENVARFLKEHSGAEMVMYTPSKDKQTVHGPPLRLRLPEEELITCMGYKITQTLVNLPEGEVYFLPLPGTATGCLALRLGSYFHLSEPIEGEIIWNFKDGGIVSCENIGQIDESAYRKMSDHFGDPLNGFDNRYLCEVGTGTNVGTKTMPKRSQIYNITVLEKILGIHLAYGNDGHLHGSIHPSGNVHLDTLFTYGDIEVDGILYMQNGELNLGAIS